MAISGLVLTLTEQPALRQSTLEALNARPTISVGAAQGLKLPIVIDESLDVTRSSSWEWLHQLPGVVHVDLVYANFEDESGFNH